MEKQPGNRNQANRRTPQKLIRIVLVMVGLTACGWLFSWWIGRQVKPAVLAALNQQLIAPVSVSQIRFSLFEHFPSASVTFSDVMAMPVFTGKFDTLLTAQEFSVLIRWIDLFKQSRVISKLVLKNGNVNLHLDESGNENYRIWKSDTAETGQLEFKNIVLNDVSLNYLNDRSGQKLHCVIKSGQVSAILDSTAGIHADCRLLHTQFQTDGQTWLSGQPLLLALHLDYSPESGMYRFENTQLKVADLVLQVSGRIIDSGKNQDFDLSITSGKASLRSVLSVIPERYSGEWRKYKAVGNTTLELSINGRQSDKQKPLYRLRFRTDNGSLVTGKPEIELKNIRLAGEWVSTNGKHTDRLNISQFSAQLNGRPVEGNLTIEDLSKPRVTVQFQSEATLEDLSRFYMPGYLKNISGDLVIRNGRFSGLLSDSRTHTSSGTISIRNAALQFKDRAVGIADIEGTLSLDKNVLIVRNLSGNTALSNFAFAGSFKNLPGYLFGYAPLEMSGSLQSSMLDLNEIMRKEKSADNDTVYRLQFADDFLFDLKLMIENIRFGKFSASGMSGSVSLRNQSFSVNQVSFETMDGNAKISGSITAVQPDSLLITADAALIGININKMFYQLGNFDQQVITDKNLKGTVTAAIKMSSRWSDRLTCNSQSIIAWSDLTVENGEVIDFAPMRALSGYLKGSDLNHIRFSTLKNQIEIKSRQVFIPQMEIRSSAADITLSGTHSFDNFINYSVQLLLSQLTGRKVKSLNTEFGQIEEDNLGRTKLFLKLSGPASSPKISYDARAVKEKIQAEFKKEKQTIKELLKEEFGKNKTETKPDNPKQKELQIEEDE